MAVICVQEGSGFVTDSSLQENFHVVTRHHSAVLLNEDAFKCDISCTPCSLRYETLAVEGMAVTRRFFRAPDQSCCIAIANIHFNTECAKRRSVCSALLLLIRDLCLKFGAVVLTGDFNKAVERETSSSDGERRTSQMEAGHK